WAYVAYDLNERFQIFKTTAGIADSINDGKPEMGAGPFTFTVTGNGKLLWQSQPLQKPGEVDPCQVSVDGISRLILQIHCPGSASDAEPVWVEPRLMGNQKGYPDSASIQGDTANERAMDFYVKNGEIDKTANNQDTNVVTLLGTW